MNFLASGRWAKQHPTKHWTVGLQCAHYLSFSVPGLGESFQKHTTFSFQCRPAVTVKPRQQALWKWEWGADAKRHQKNTSCAGERKRGREREDKDDMERHAHGVTWHKEAEVVVPLASRLKTQIAISSVYHHDILKENWTQKKRQKDKPHQFHACTSPPDLADFLGPQEASEGVSTGLWCVPGCGAGAEIALEPPKLQKGGENLAKLLFSAPNPGMHQTVVQRDLK